MHHLLVVKLLVVLLSVFALFDTTSGGPKPCEVRPPSSSMCALCHMAMEVLLQGTTSNAEVVLVCMYDLFELHSL